MGSENIYLIGNAHLDPIWLWRWQEGCGEVMQTFRSALDRLNEYPGFIFTCSSAAYYRWVEEIDPAMFEEIVKMVKTGRWVPVNGWWVQPDCNMPSGESFARQALYSQLYYYEKFGKICKTGYNVDSFGHNAMLPQLLRNGGMSTYVMMRPGKHENPDMPENAFWWESADGSRVLTYRIPSSYAESGKNSLDRSLKNLNERCEQNGHGMMLFYGVGNHGGGPTRGDIEYLSENMNREGYRKLQFASPDEFFEDLLQTRIDLPVWKDELQHHASGCYSATSMIKQLNRRAENLLGSAEKWDTVSALFANSVPSTEKFAEAWRDVCFNQFHDILCGCSITEAYEDSRDALGGAMATAARAYNNALLRIAAKIDTWVDGVSEPVCEVRHHSAEHRFPRPVVVFNPLSRAVSVPVRTYHPSCSAKDSAGNDIPFQNVRSSRSNDSHMDTVFIAQVPAFGYSTYWLRFLDTDPEDADMPELETAVNAHDGNAPFIENEFIRAEFNPADGSISQIINKEDGKNYAAPGFALPTVISDEKTDTWAHNVFYFHDIKGTMQLESIELAESGPVRAVMRVKHRFGESHLTQDFILAEGQKTLRVKCKAIWQEKLTLLKMPFPMEGSDEISTYEIPCGFIKRPCNGEEEPALKWGDLTVTSADGARTGVSIISDSKYSYDCPGKELRLTCLRNVIFADHYSHRPPADFNYTDEGLQRFEYGIYLHTGEAEASDVAFEALCFNNRPVAVPESYHKGEQPQVKSFLSISADNIAVTAFKLCEDGSSAAIIRLYETQGRDTCFDIVCDLIDTAFRVDIRRNEIKTFRIEKGGEASEVNFLEGTVGND